MEHADLSDRSLMVFSQDNNAHNFISICPEEKHIHEVRKR